MVIIGEDIRDNSNRNLRPKGSNFPGLSGTPCLKYGIKDFYSQQRSPEAPVSTGSRVSGNASSLGVPDEDIFAPRSVTPRSRVQAASSEEVLACLRLVLLESMRQLPARLPVVALRALGSDQEDGRGQEALAY